MAVVGEGERQACGCYALLLPQYKWTQAFELGFRDGAQEHDGCEDGMDGCGRDGRAVGVLFFLRVEEAYGAGA